MKRIEVIGKKIGQLTVLDEYKKGNLYFCKCKCDCGNIIGVQKANLMNGHSTSCGCKGKNKEYDNLVGKRFGKLIVLEQLNVLDDNGHKHYLCKCDCGNEIEVLGVNLLYDQTKSCGCFKKARQIDSKISTTNKSGVKGVHYDRAMKKWIAKLTFNRVVYKSSHSTFEEAVKKRKEYENLYHKPFIDEYGKI